MLLSYERGEEGRTRRIVEEEGRRGGGMFDLLQRAICCKTPLIKSVRNGLQTSCHPATPTKKTGRPCLFTPL